MAVYLGNSGMVTLCRDQGDQWLATFLDAADVNVGQRRFSVNFYSDANRDTVEQTDSILNFITGDRLEIRTVPVDDVRPDLELIPDWTDPAITRYVYVDAAGGMRLYESFADSLEGKAEKAIELQAPSAPQRIEMRATVSALARCMAQVTSYEITTSRETIDTTVLTNRYKQQYDNGLIQGQGKMTCFWKHELGMCDNDIADDPIGGIQRYPEVSMYLAQLILRLDQGSDFKGFFWIYRDPENDDQSIWYEPDKCVITNCVVTVEPTAVIETTIEFVCTGRIQLKQGIIPDRLLQEGTPTRSQDGYVTDEFFDNPVELANRTTVPFTP